jgi:hypothetical protein
MPFSSGLLKPEYVKNFVKPLDSIISIFPLIYWIIIARESNDNAETKLDLQFKNNGKRTMSLDPRKYVYRYSSVLWNTNDDRVGISLVGRIQ